jgi:beta-mannosidase
VKTSYLSFAYKVDGEIVSSGTTLFTKPKHFDFVDPHITLSVEGDEIVITADAYARYVAITNKNDDLVLSDNFFDMNKGVCRVKIVSGDPVGLKVRSVYDIR